MFSLFGYGTGKSQNASEPETKQALPASWFRSEHLYELERRAIFSRKWLLISHKLRFQAPGDYIQFTEAGYSFFLVMDREGNINGFHNVCRHRAYPLLQQDQGNAKILSCKYHGWSYGLKGNLAKAPNYQDLPTFDKSQNNLFRIHVHIDRLDFIWVNLDGSETPAVKWEDDLKDVDIQKRFAIYDLSQFKFNHTWEMDANYNWKALADNYNECYHCPTTHPDVPTLSDLSTYDIETKDGHLQHFTKNKDSDENSFKFASTYYFPNSCMTLSPNFFYMMRCVATSATTSHMEYQVFRHKDAKDEDFNFLDALFKRVLGEDKDLCNAAQKNLNTGVYVSGELHPKMEKGSLYIQDSVRRIVKAHFEEEQKVGHQIWPARQTIDQLRAVDEDEDFCNKLACAAEGATTIAW